MTRPDVLIKKGNFMPGENPSMTDFMIELNTDIEIVRDLWQAQPADISFEETWTRSMPDAGALITIFLVAKHGLDAVTAATKIGLLLSQILDKKTPQIKCTRLRIKLGNRVDRTKIEGAFEHVVESNWAVIEYDHSTEPTFAPLTTDVSALLRAAKDSARKDKVS
jgi:hypothetical protein